MNTAADYYNKIIHDGGLLRAALDKAVDGIVITAPLLEDNPIVFASNGFYKLTYYTLDEIIGKNCRFLQGEETNKETVKIIRRSIDDSIGFKGVLTNYRKNGEKFESLLTIEPIVNRDGIIEYFIGSQLDVSKWLPDRA